MNEVTVLTYGDSRSLATWSNVPYFFTESLEQQGLRVNRVNMQPPLWMVSLWNRVFLRLIHLFLPGSTYIFDRTPFYRLLANHRMKAAVQRYPDSDLFIAISFSFHPKKYTSKPVLMFGDWTYDYFLGHFQHRHPDILERQEIRNQIKLQKTADAMLVLFPDVCEYVKQQGFAKNVFYLGNVINSEPYGPTEDAIQQKYDNNNLVFIGSRKYLPGLKVLLQALRLLGSEAFGKLSVIGMTPDDVPTELLTEQVEILGYLNKSNDQQRETYYRIVNDAKIFVNTNPEWAAFSATLDVMYHQTPVITSEYRSFVQTFGQTPNFGFYSANDPAKLAARIRSVLTMQYPDYLNLAKNAAIAVKPYSWERYTAHLFAKLKETKVIVETE